jgi:RNA polymerase sigma-70 factor (ECF subfamily)
LGSRRERPFANLWIVLSKPNSGIDAARKPIPDFHVVLSGMESVNPAAPGQIPVVSLEPDAGLMLRVRDGDTASFALLVERHRAPIVQFMSRMVQNHAVGEELAQEAFLRVYRSRMTYQPTAKFTTWLFRISTHLALNWLRGQKGEKGLESLDRTPLDGQGLQLSDRCPTVEQRLVYETQLREIRGAIDLLPAKQRAAVLMHKYEELDYAQIAVAMNCSESAIKSLLFRAYESLRGRLAHLDNRDKAPCNLLS